MRNTMKIVCYAFVSTAAMSINVFSQEPPANLLVAGERGLFAYVSGSVLGGAQKMPEENYSFKPTPEIRSFGQLVGHVADAQYMFCSVGSGEKNPAPGVEKSMTTKADLVQALKDSIAYCNKAYAGMTDARASEPIKLLGRDSARLLAFTLNTAHSDEHYGNMVTYLRLKGIVPPTSPEPKAAASADPKK
jgi:uncharacterized damage-inducible protein DinB